MPSPPIRASYAGLIFNPNDVAFPTTRFAKPFPLGIDRANIGKNSNGDLLPAYGLIPPAVHWNGTAYRRQRSGDTDCL